MREQTDAVRRAHGLTLRLHVGLNSGEVVVRTIGNDLHMDYSAVGPTTHLAARMEQVADPGSSLLTAATLRLVEGLVLVQPVGPGLRPATGLAARGRTAGYRAGRSAAPGPRLHWYREFANEYTGVDRAFVHSQRALAIGTALDDVELQVQPTFYLGQIHFDQGEYRPAIDCFRRNVTTLHGELLHARFDNVSLPAIQNRLHLARCLTVTGAFAEAMTFLIEAVQMAEALDRSYERVAAYARLGHLHLWQGNVHLAIPVLERGLALAEDANVSIFLPLYLPYLAVAYGRAGRTPEALARLDQAMAYQDAVTGAYAAEACLLVCRLQEAHTVARRALENQQRRKLRGLQVRTLWLLGEAAMQHQPADHEAAEAYYRQALTLAEELGVRPFQAHCHHGLGRLYRHTGRIDLARAELATAIDLYRSMEMAFWLPEAAAALAQVEGRV